MTETGDRLAVEVCPNPLLRLICPNPLLRLIFQSTIDIRLEGLIGRIEHYPLSALVRQCPQQDQTLVGFDELETIDIHSRINKLGNTFILKQFGLNLSDDFWDCRCRDACTS